MTRILLGLLSVGLVSASSLPLGFEANRGQADRTVRFLLRGPGYTLLLKRDEAALLAHGGPSRGSSYLGMKLMGVSRAMQIEGRGELPGRSNYFRGIDPGGWVTDVPRYSAVRYRGVYPGIDLIFHVTESRLEYDWEIAPGASPQVIRLAFQGVKALYPTADGALIARTRDFLLRYDRPLAYQKASGVRKRVSARYRFLGKREIGVEVSHYDRTRSLIIDPVLSYSTVLGGSGLETRAGRVRLLDEGRGIAIDGAGNAYVVGTAYSPDFPAINSALRQSTGGPNCFVAKLNPAGSLVYVSFLGPVVPPCNGGAVDGQGSALVTGVAGPGFPVFKALQPTPGGNLDAFVAKLSPDGTSLVYSTFLGGVGNDSGVGVAADPGGNAYVVGTTSSADFPTTPGAVRFVPPGLVGGLFTSKISSDGGRLVYSAILRGSGASPPQPSAIAIDTTGNAFVVGVSPTGFPTTSGALQTTSSEGGSFVVKLNANGSALVYSTYYVFGTINAIAVDSAGNAYLAGLTGLSDFPVTPGAFQTTARFDPSFRWKGFVTKLNAAGSAVLYATYLGGSSQDSVNGIAVDASGNAYLTGFTNSPDFPLAKPLQGALGGGTCSLSGSTQGPFLPCFDAFITKLNPGGSGLLFSTLLGGGDQDFGSAIAVKDSDVYITGVASSQDFPITDSMPRPKGAVLLARISDTADAPVFTAASVTNAASFTGGLTPGAIATVFGSGLTSAGGILLPPAMPAAAEIAGTSVTVNGFSAPLLAVANVGGREQINFVVPWEIVCGRTAEIVVVNNGVRSLPIRVSVFLAQPGVFTVDGAHAAAQHGSDYTLVSPTNPAQRGEIIVVYGTGLGPVHPPVLTFQPAPASPLSTTLIPPAVRIGGSGADVLFSGLAPGYLGLYQLNIRVPHDAPAGDLDLVVGLGDQASKPVKLPVQ
jgi:uncharacterized protein (TIGR03437 family)